MATKPLKSVHILLMDGQTEFDVADTVASAIASAVIAQFDRKETLVFPSNGATVKIPFHAVMVIGISVSDSEAFDPADPYCGE